MTYKNILALVAVAAVFGIFGIFMVILQQPWTAGASVRVGDQYQSTTTPQVADATNLCPARPLMASSTTGVLGSVNVLGAGTGELAIYDATTTNINLRTGNTATTSMILAWYPAGFATSSSHFDIEFKRGLLIDFTSGVATSTISYRCEG